jgi:hypothetical protein
MGTSTIAGAASKAVCLYLTTALRLKFEPVLPEYAWDLAAQVDWAGGDLAAVQIECRLATIRLLLARQLPVDAKAKLKRDREALEDQAVCLGLGWVEDQLDQTITADPGRALTAIETAQICAHHRWEGTSSNRQWALMAHQRALGDLELEARTALMDQKKEVQYAFCDWT